MSKLFWAMLAFISRLPVPTRWSQGLDFEEYSRGIVTFPLIGMLLGAIGGLVFVALQSWCGIPLAALFCVLTLALLTGGFTSPVWRIPVTVFFPPAAGSGCWKLCVTAAWAPTAGWR